MTPLFGLRLCLDLLAAGLLVFGLSYWWLGDTAHQLAGTVMFGLLTVHNLFNRRWWGRAAQDRRRPEAAFGIAATLVLALAAAALLATSAMITTALPDWMSPGPGFTARQVHVLAAYWVFAAVSVHLGLRWPVIMAVARRVLGFARANPKRTAALRLAAFCIAAQGVRSFSVLGIGGRLAMRMSLDWWNFEEAALPFFLHCAAAAGLLVAASYYVSQALRVAERVSGRAPHRG